MDHWQTTVNATAVGAGLATLLGLAARGRLARASFFAFFVAVVSAYGIVVAARPTTITWRVWLVKELTLGIVALLAAIEIGARTFARRRGARPRAGLAALAATGFTALLLALDLSPQAVGPFSATAAVEVASFDLARSLLPRLAYGCAWLFTALWATARRFAIPLDTLHEAVLLGFSSYWTLQAAGLASLDSPERSRLASDILTLAFLLVLLAWAAVAWRRDRLPSAPPAVVREIWPWS